MAVRQWGRKPHSTGLKTRTKSDRAWRITAGPVAGLDPINLQGPLDPDTAARTRRANARYWAEATLIGPRDWPINLFGGTDLRLSTPKLKPRRKL